MLQDIFVGFLCVVVAAAGLWGWWIDNGDTLKKDNHKEEKCNEENQSDLHDRSGM